MERLPIQVLDQNTINKIAAGEVIERPSSVVKELVENAIDAGATAITIEIKEGGISFIRITDNGCGIKREEIPMAFLRHSTSKIKSIEDLMCVASLGFRGEALSSIAAVAQIELITKTADDMTGSRYVIEGGEEKSLEEVGAPDGTTFIVRNLFYNTPVRRKFLKTAATEGGYVNALIEHLALSHPDISFKFISNNQNRLHTSGNTNLKDIIYSVYGRDITKNLIEVNASTQDIKITGFIGKPVICRGNRGFENYYINGRYIKSHIITKAIEEAYKGFIMPHNYPFTAIHFEINPAILDVNVHPTKMELRFSKNEFVYQFVLESLVTALKHRELIPEVRLETPKTVPGVAQRSTQTPQQPIIEQRQASGEATESRKETCVRSVTPQPPVMSQPPEKKERERLPEPFEVNRIKQQERQQIQAQQIKQAESVAETQAAEQYGVVKAQVKQQQDAPVKQETKPETNLETKQMNLFEDKLLDKQHKGDYRLIGQLFETYWLIEFEDKFYMMDQHAAHEKILYERLMKKFAEKKYDTQMILPPVVLSLNMREEQVLKENFDIFAGLGYEIEEFGGREYKVTGLPGSLPTAIDCRRLLTDIIDSLAEDNAMHAPELITEKVASMSCKAAVKGNNKLFYREAEELMQELMQAENPYNCPHGRPTLIMMTKYEIEKKFKRIV